MRDLEFGVPSLLREGARRLATSPDPDAPWRRLRDGPDSVEQDIANLIGMFDEVCHSDEERALVRDRVKDMLTPRPATDSCGFAHLRDLVQEIERGYSLKDCFVWCGHPHPCSLASPLAPLSREGMHGDVLGTVTARPPLLHSSPSAGPRAPIPSSPRPLPAHDHRICESVRPRPPLAGTTPPSFPTNA